MPYPARYLGNCAGGKYLTFPWRDKVEPVKEHPLYCWTKRELIRPAKKAVRSVSTRRTTRQVREEMLARERELRELRERMAHLEAELEQAPRRSREQERLRQATRQRLLEQQKVLNVSLALTDKRAADDTGTRKLPRRSRNQARREARLMFFLLAPICGALCYITVRLLLQ